ncbi:MAG: response regulator [Lachnospiraceae bacterium]|nr:response regulator [Lachnospiraceae bacterium]
MRKILLIGKLSDIVRSISEILSDEFNVQVSSLQMANISGMIKIAKPELIILSLVGVDKLDLEIFEWLNLNVEKIPILVVTSHENWEIAQDVCTGEQFTPFFPPINREMLIGLCNSALKVDKDARDKAVQPARKKYVLVVDDNATVLRSIKAMLEDKYEIALATNGEMGIQKAIDSLPDVILLDYEMPGMNGNATFETILQIDEIKRIPVIFLTGVSDRERVSKVLDKHPAGYTLKPPDKDKLIEQIETVLKKYS